MIINAETSAALLEGSAYGFVSVPSHVDKHFQDYIVEVRAAQTEKRAVPQPSAAYQTRSLAAGHFLKKLFPTRNAKSLQQRFLEMTGREYRYTPVRKTTNSKPGQLSPVNVAALKRVGISEATFESMSLRTRSNTLAAEILKGYRELDSSRVTSTATDGMTAAEIRRAFEKTMGWK